MATQGYQFSGVPSVNLSPDLAIRSGGVSFGTGNTATSAQTGSGVLSDLGNFLSTFSTGSPASSAPAYASGYNVTGGVVTGPGQVSTSQIDGQASWQNSMQNGLAGILSMIGAHGDQQGATVQPASYQTGGKSGTDWGVILFLVAGAGLAIYAATK
ncbi:hypothetical protein DL1_00390 [Thioclava dalianensis]|uniref:Uncharacterized protein n=1 Tax=Thioclava dalianensis TaxID=1185766 RepID=A0A074UAR0_9RHOB|nr:hypothetical protein [Thioclava dalianensis]KEP71762.1 hypothetical protein DL1_00390 [Thioclava dalianensis]SFN65187.1 hypothetical protein SAMN05216224_108142 [Thioclava dalianensis]